MLRMHMLMYSVPFDENGNPEEPIEESINFEAEDDFELAEKVSQYLIDQGTELREGIKHLRDRQE